MKQPGLKLCPSGVISVENKFDILHMKLGDGLNTKLDGLHTKLDDVASELDRLHRELDSVHRKVDALAETLCRMLLGMTDAVWVFLQDRLTDFQNSRLERKAD